MSNIAAAQPVPQAVAKYEAEFERIMAEANMIREHRHQKQKEAEQREAKALKTEREFGSSHQIREDLEALATGIKELHCEVQALTLAVQQGQWEQRHDREMAAKDCENLLLRLELSLTRAGRTPSPGGSE